MTHETTIPIISSIDFSDPIVITVCCVFMLILVLSMISGSRKKTSIDEKIEEKAQEQLTESTPEIKSTTIKSDGKNAVVEPKKHGLFG